MKALFNAASKGDAAEVQRLIQAKADLEQRDEFGLTPLLLASWEGCGAVVGQLIGAKANPNAVNVHGASPLYMAAQNGHADVVARLLAAKADLEQYNKFHQTPLFAASWEGRGEVVDQLVVAKADVNAVNVHGASSLYMAAENGHADVAARLIAAKADLEQENKFHQTPLLLASWKGRGEVVDQLVVAKADVNAVNHCDASSLYVAAKSSHAAVAARLIAAKADLEQYDKFHQTPLFVASWEGCGEVVDQLVVAKADVNAVNVHGASPLYMAAENGHADVVVRLLAAKADPHVRNTMRASALDSARKHGHRQVEASLVVAEAPTLKNLARVVKGSTPYEEGGCLDQILNKYEELIAGHKKADQMRAAADILRTLFERKQQAPVFVSASLERGIKKDAVLKLLLNAYKSKHTGFQVTNDKLLHELATSRIARIQRLISQRKVGVNQADIEGRSLLYSAASHGRADMVDMLLSNKADPNLALGNGVTPLYMAAQNGFADVVGSLLRGGADASLVRHIAGKRDVSPLLTAVNQGHEEVVTLLCQHGVANGQITQQQLDRALSYAANQGREEIARTLIASGANPGLVSPDMATPMYRAVRHNHLKVVELLIQHKVSVDFPCAKSAVPLLVAADNGHRAMAELLLQHGAAVSVDLCRSIDGIDQPLGVLQSYRDTLSLLASRTILDVTCLEDFRYLLDLMSDRDLDGHPEAVIETYHMLARTAVVDTNSAEAVILNVLEQGLDRPVYLSSQQIETLKSDSAELSRIIPLYYEQHDGFQIYEDKGAVLSKHDVGACVDQYCISRGVDKTSPDFDYAEFLTQMHQCRHFNAATTLILACHKGCSDVVNRVLTAMSGDGRSQVLDGSITAGRLPLAVAYTAAMRAIDAGDAGRRINCCKVMTALLRAGATRQGMQQVDSPAYGYLNKLIYMFLQGEGLSYKSAAVKPAAVANHPASIFVAAPSSQESAVSAVKTVEEIVEGMPVVPTMVAPTIATPRKLGEGRRIAVAL